MGTDAMDEAGERGGGGLFHDAQDVPMPTLSVYDPERLWEYVERPLMVYMPLRKLVAKVIVVVIYGVGLFIYFFTPECVGTLEYL